MKGDDLNILLARNNKDTDDIIVIDKRPYVANVTDKFIWSSLQPSTATHKLIVQVVTTDGIIVSTTTITSISTSPTPVITTSTSSKK